MTATEVKEGKIELKAAIHGLFRVDKERLLAVNSLDEIMIATRHTNSVVHPRRQAGRYAGHPLIVSEDKGARRGGCRRRYPLLELPSSARPPRWSPPALRSFLGRIEDKFTPCCWTSWPVWGGCDLPTSRSPMTGEQIVSAIQAAHASGADLILCTGGMSVDPDDQDPRRHQGRRRSGDRLWRLPVLPGAMFLLGFFADGTPVMGLPGCVMYAKATIFDPHPSPGSVQCPGHPC